MLRFPCSFLILSLFLFLFLSSAFVLVARLGWKVTLVESMTKRCAFLKHAVSLTRLSNVEVVNERAEVWCINSHLESSYVSVLFTHYHISIQKFVSFPLVIPLISRFKVRIKEERVVG